MPASVISAQAVSVSGLTATLAAANAAGNFFTNTGKEVLVVANGSASPITVTIDAQTACNHGTQHDGGGAVAAGATAYFGPFNVNRFNDSSEYVQVTYSSETSVTVGVLQVTYA